MVILKESRPSHRLSPELSKVTHVNFILRIPNSQMLLECHGNAIESFLSRLAKL